MISMTRAAKGLLWPTLHLDDFHDTGRKGSDVAYCANGICDSRLSKNYSLFIMFINYIHVCK